MIFVFSGWYLGCFNEKPENRAFNISAGNYIVSDTSAQECTSACAYLNQSYAATEGDLCLCANGSYNKYGQAASEQLCDLVCSDAQSCNDTSHIRVYSTQDAIGGLEIQAPQIGWLLQKVNFTSSVGKGKQIIAFTTAYLKLYFLSFPAGVTLMKNASGRFMLRKPAGAKRQLCPTNPLKNKLFIIHRD